MSNGSSTGQTTDSTSIRGRYYAVLGRLLGTFWLVFLAYPINDLLRSEPGPAFLASGLAGLAAFVGVYLRLMLRDFYGGGTSVYGGRNVRVLLAVLVALAVALNAVYGESGDWLGLFIFAGAAAGMRLPARRAIVVVLGLAVLPLGFGWFWGLETPQVGLFAVQVLGIGLGLIGWAHTIATIEELKAARREIARLAVSEERLRFARDLHDLLGHSLTTIALKSELAGRLIEASPEKAAAEVEDVERVAREALSEVREAVAGYRRPTLRSELEGARSVLEAAGISCRIESGAGGLPAAADAVLGWAVREGATNVVRHSGARRCDIRVRREGEEIVVAEVVDNGRGATREQSEADTTGSGLSGLAERVAGGGGRLEARPGPGGGFRLRVALPVGAESARERAGVGGAAGGRG